MKFIILVLFIVPSMVLALGENTQTSCPAPNTGSMDAKRDTASVGETPAQPANGGSNAVSADGAPTPPQSVE